MHNKINKIIICAPFHPHSGGMVNLAVMISNGLEKEGLDVKRLDIGFGLKGIFLLPFFYIKMIYNIYNADAVHIISASGKALIFKDLPAVIFGFLFNKKVVLNFVGGTAVDKSTNWSIFKKLPFILADTIILPTKSFANKLTFSDNVKKKFKIIYNPVNIDKFKIDKKKTIEKSPILISVKSLDDYSGQDILLDFFQKYKKRFSNSKLWIVGNGPMKNSLIRKAKKLNLKDVTFYGKINSDRLSELMKEASIFVHASKYESFGIAIVEAMAAGLPIIAFNIGGIPDIVIEGKHGYLVEYLNHDDFLYKAIKLTQNHGLYNDISSNCISRSNQFQWDKIRDHWLITYGHLR